MYVFYKKEVFIRRFFTALIVLWTSLAFVSELYAQSVISPANSISNLCTSGAYQQLSTITISETTTSDFGAFAGPTTFILSAPSGFQFDTSSPTAIGFISAGDLTVNTLSPTPSATFLTVSVTVTGTSTLDQFTISGLNIRAIAPASSGDILRYSGASGGTFSITGDAAAGWFASYGFVQSLDPPVFVPNSDVSGCPGASQASINFTTDSDPVTSISWTLLPSANAASIGMGSSSGTGPIPSFTYASNTTGSDIVGAVSVTATKNGCASSAMSFTITLKAEPVLTNPGNQFVCSGQGFSLVWATDITGSVVNWNNSNPLIGLGSSGSGDLSFTAPVNTSGVPVVGIITATASRGGCTSVLRTFNITINPAPVIDFQTDVSGCPGTSQGAIGFTSNTDPGTVYSWTLLPSANAASIGMGSSSGTGPIPSFTYASNTTGSDIVGAVSVTATKNGCASSAMSFTITLKAEPVLTNPGNQFVCSGQGFSLVWATDITGSVVNWNNSNPLIGLGSSGSGDLSFTAPVNASGVPVVGIITATASRGGCTSVLRTFNITINPAPVIDPQADVSGCPGTSQGAIGFTSNTDPGTVYSWTLLPSANAASIGMGSSSGTGPIPSFTYASNTTGSDIVGAVSVTATKNGCASSSMSFTITLKAEPVLTNPGNQFVCSGQGFSLVWATDITGSVVNWNNSNPLIGLGSSGSGDLSFTAPVNTSGVPVVGIITATASRGGCTSVLRTFNITINPAPVIDFQSDVSGCPGTSQGSIGFTSNTDPGTVYSWTLLPSANAASIGMGSSSGTGPIPSFTYASNTTGSDIVGAVSVTATKNGCASSAMSFTITLKAEPVLTNPGNQFVCSGQGFSLVWATDITGSVVNWNNSNPLIGLGSSGSGDLSFTAPVNTSGVPVVGIITATASRGGCTSVLRTFNITINPAPVIDFQTDVSGCPGTSQGAIGFTSNTDPGTFYSWTLLPSANAASIGMGSSSGTGPIPSFTYASNTTGSDIVGAVSVTATKNGCASSAMSFTITLKAEPVLTNPGNQFVCSGQGFSLVWATDITGSVVNWNNSNPLIGLGSSGSGDLSFTAPVNTSGVPVVGIITATASRGGCTSVLRTFNITINPAPVIDPQADVSGCPGTSQGSIGFTSNTDPGTVYSWTLLPSANAASIGMGSSSGTGPIPSFTYASNTTGSDIVGAVSVTATKNGCASSSMSFTITLKAEPVLTNPGNQFVCSGQGFSLVWATDITGSVVNWNNSNPLIGLGSSGSGDLSFTAPVNTSGVPVVGIITATASRGGCTSVLRTFNITINPAPVIDPQSDVSGCPGTSQGSIGFTSNTDPGTSYSWSVTNAGLIGVAASGTSSSIPGWTYLPNVSGSDITGIATVTATKNGCSSAVMNFTITLKAQPVLTNPGPALSYCAGQLISISWITNTPGSTITWSNTNAAIGLGTAGTGNLSFIASPNTTGLPITGTINATAARNGCASVPISFTITINPTPVMTQQANLSACPGASQLAIPFATDVDPVTSYSWSITNAGLIGVSASGTSGSIPGWTYSANTTGSDIVGIATVTATKNSCTSAPMTFSITLKAQPVLTNPGPSTFCAGQAVSIVWATNTPGSIITWSNDNAAIGLGAGPSSGDINFTAASNTTGVPVIGNITATASRNGCVSAVQNFAITIKPTPVMTQQANLSACPGASQLAIPFATDVDPVTSYSWSITNAGLIGVSASGTSGSIPGWTYSANTTGADIVGVATVTATKNSCTSAPMTFSITLKAQPVLTNPGPSTFCAGQAVSIVWATNTPGSIITWSNDNAGIGLGAGPSSGDINFTAASNTTGVPVIGNITATASRNGCVSAVQNFAITIKPTPVMTQQANLSACPGASQLAIPFATDVDPVTSYSWSITNAGLIGVSASGTSGSIPGWTYSANTTGSDIVGIATVTATKNSCTSAPMTFSITLKAQPVLTNPGPSTFCAGQAVSIVWATNTPGSIITWSNDNAAIGLGAGPSSGDINFTAASNTTGVPVIGNITATASRNGCVSAVQNFAITIKPTPVMTQQANLSACPGASQLAIPFATDVDPVTSYSWSITNAGLIGVSASGTSGSIPGWTYSANTTGADIVGVATVTATKNSCTSAPMTFSITLKAQPVLTNPGPSTFCAGQAVSIVWATNTPGSIITWSNDNAAIGLGAGPSSGDINFTAASNTTGVPVIGNITATASRNGCVSAVQNFAITINPTPVINQQANIIACPGASQTTITFGTNADPVSTYAWNITNAGLLGVSASGTSGSIPGWTFAANNTGSDIVGIATVTASKNSCISAPMTFSITLKARPVLVNPGPLTYCAGQAVSIVWVTNTPGSIVTWTNDTPAIGLGAGPNSGDINFTAASNTTGVPIVANIVATASRNGCASAIQPFTITIKPTPVITQQANLSACPGASQTAIPLLTNADPVTSYTWSITNAGLIGVNASGTSSSIPGWTYLTNTTGSDIVGVATVTTTKNGCSSAPMIFSISLKAQPVLPAQSDVIYCPGQAISIPFVSNASGSSISWTNSNTAIGIPATGSGDLNFTAPPNNTSSNVTGNIVVLASKNGCVSTPLNFTITIRPSPQFTITNTTPNICEGTPVDITLNSITSGAVMTLTGLSYGGGSGTPIPLGTTFTNGQKITELINNPLNTAITVVYTFSVAANTCSNPVTQSTSVVVKPNPTANGSNTVICSGQNALVLINGSPENVPGTTYDWVVSASGNVTGAIAGNGSTINQPLTLSNSVVGTVQYLITPTANSCVGPVKIITVTINPIATVDAGVDYQVCEPVTIPLSGTIGGAATTGTWIVVSGAGSVSGSTTAGTVVTATYTVNAADITNTIVLRLQTNDPDGAGPCNLVSDVLNIQINRKPTAVTVTDYTSCEPASFAASPIFLTGTIGGSATTGLWSVVTGAGSLSATNVSGSTVTANYVLSPSDVGTTITFRLTSNDADGLGPCTTVSDDLNILINKRAVVSAGPDLALCRNNPSIALQGSFVAGTTPGVLWTGGAGIFSNNANPTSNYSFTPPEVNTTFILTLTAADPDGAGPCTAVADQMNLTINPLPVVNFFGLPSSVAENISPFPLSGTLTGGLFTIMPVTSLIGPTTASPTDQAMFDPSAVTLGFNTVTYTFTDFKGCTNSISKSIVVNPVTTIDFALQYSCAGPAPCPFVPVNGTSEFELCGNVGIVKFVGNPAAPSGLIPTNFIAVGPNAAVIQAKISSAVAGGPGPDFFLDTNGLPSDTYLVQYNYTNSNGDPSTPVTRAIKVFASPIAVISNSLNNCISGPINFVDGSSINPTPYPTTITSWRWDFKDGTFGNVQNPSHVYTTSGTYNIDLVVTTSQGCSGQTSLPIRVGDVPLVDFDWSAICTNDLTNYLDKTNPGSVSTIVQYTWEFGDGDILTGAAGASVPGGTHGGRTTGTLKNPNHNFVTNGTYSTKLIVDTDDLCTNSKSQSVFILPAGSTVKPDAATPYLADFNANDFGWISQGLRTAVGPPPVISPNSWAYGVPSGPTITSPNRVWWTGTGTSDPKSRYYASEQSAVNGPCFDLTLLKRPMIAMDYWSDAEKNLDGAVLQYSINGGNTWVNVGPPTTSPNEGINWYEGQVVQSNPGQQPFDRQGWTDKIGGWKNGRFHLDMIPVAQRSQVRIRVAFSSNGSNDPTPTYDGFAFDNVFVGDKMRNVLVEHFTNSSLQASVAGDTWINDRYQDQITFRGTSDFNDVQYHIAFPGADPLNTDNLTDPAARAATFGISQSPATVMDGILNTQFTGKYTDITRIEIDRRALNEPLFDLQLENVATSNSNLISVKLTMTARKAISTPLIAQVILVENQVGTFKNVVRKQLLGSGGETITLPFMKGDILVKSQNNVVINVPIVNPSQTKLVGYIQDKNTREIYQSIVIPILAPFKSGQVITGIEEPLTSTPSTLNGITVHPNPASGKVYLNIPDNRSAEGFSWKLVDQRGVTLKSGEFDDMINNNKQIDISGYANGVYIIALTGPGKTVVYQKLVILNGN